MRIYEMPRCCAMKVIADFSGAHGVYASLENDLADLKKFVVTYGSYMLHVNLNSDQKPKYHSHLIDLKFEMVATSTAPGSERKVYHYVRVKPKVIRKKVIKKEAWE